MAAESTRVAGPSLKSVAMPAQHGGWSFALEPVLVGLLVAPTAGGLLLGVAAFMVFLLDQPLRVAVKDRRKGKYYARTRLAERAADIQAALGPQWELEEWTASWRRLHRTFPFEHLTVDLAKEVAAELTRAITLLWPYALVGAPAAKPVTTTSSRPYRDRYRRRAKV